MGFLGVRVRVNNTDAEGRMAMGDVLCRMKELAPNQVTEIGFKYFDSELFFSKI